MPLQRGYLHQNLGPTKLGTVAWLVITNDRWNAAMSQIGVLPVRRVVLPFETPYVTALPDGTSVVSCALIAPEIAPPAGVANAIGPAIGVIEQAALDSVEDQLRDFLQLPQLLGTPSPRATRPPAGVINYPLWAEIYKEVELTEGEHKRFIIVSPNHFNAVAQRVVAVRTTTKFKADEESFPKIQSGKAQACCGDASTSANSELMLVLRDRPVPHTTSTTDMVKVARGLAFTHELGASLRRAGSDFPLAVLLTRDLGAP